MNTMENQTDPEVLEWFDGLKNRLSSFHQSTVQKDKDDLAQREAEYIKSENEELLKLEEEIDKQIV
ncbi:hypothetical protein IJU97_05630 [bacterium]|nr:hypothetical protein [bacterium]